MRALLYLQPVMASNTIKMYPNFVVFCLLWSRKRQCKYALDFFMSNFLSYLHGTSYKSLRHSYDTGQLQGLSCVGKAVKSEYPYVDKIVAIVYYCSQGFRYIESKRTVCLEKLSWQERSIAQHGLSETNHIQTCSY